MTDLRTSPVRLPLHQEHPLAEPSGLADLLAGRAIQRVLTPVGDPAWLVTGHAQVRALLNDDRLGRSHPEPHRAARTGESALFGGPLGNYATEDTDHARMRALLQSHFTPKRMRALRPRIAELTTGLLDDLARRNQSADLHAALALPLPIQVICELLGVPYADRERFREWTQATADTRDRARSEQGLAGFFGYGCELVARKRAEPGEDVISRLAATDGVSDEEAAGLSMALLFAGHETTVVAIGMGVLLLLAEPGRWQSLVADPALVPGAVEEILRVPARGGTGIPRYARSDLEIDGVVVGEGELVLLDTGAANHDPVAFPEPERFDPNRAGTHLTFGHGPRYCIGAPLARLELGIVIAQLSRRFPTLALDVPVERLTARREVLTGGLTALPVRW